MKRIRLSFGTVLLLAAMGLMAQRDVEETSMTGFRVDLRIGLGETPTYHLPCPIVLTVENESGKDFDGKLTIRFDESNQYGGKLQPISVPLQISNSSKKRYHFCMRLRADVTMVAELKAGRLVFWSKKQTLNDAPSDQMTLMGLRLLMVGASGPVTGLERRGNISGEQVLRTAERPTQVYHAFPWELPMSDPPLFHFRALIFGSRLTGEPINQQQLAALARYVTCGGRVVFTRQHAKLRRRLIDALPLKKDGEVESARPIDGIRLTRMDVGLGAIYDCQVALTALGTDPGLKAKLLEELATGVEPRFPDHVLTYIPWDGRTYYRETFENHTPQRGVNSLLVIAGFFFLYLIATGPLVFIFRKDRRKMATFVCSTIAGFTVLAIVVALFLRNRRGEAYWLTVTELTKDGGIQYGVLSMKSVGGRRHRLKVEGPGAGVWPLPQMKPWAMNSPFITTATGYPSVTGVYSMAGARSFNITGSLRGEALPATEHVIPLTPWGQSQALARSFWPEGKLLDVKIRVTPTTTRKPASVPKPVKPAPPSGKNAIFAVLKPRPRTSHTPNISRIPRFNADVTLQNTLNQPLSDVRLIFGLHTACTVSQNWQGVNLDTYTALELGKLAAGETRRYPTKHVVMRTSSNMPNDLAQVLRQTIKDVKLRGDACLQLPRMNDPAHLYAILVAQIEDSPSLQLGPCDFMVNKGTHYIVQRVIDTGSIDISRLTWDATKLPVQ